MFCADNFVFAMVFFEMVARPIQVQVRSYVVVTRTSYQSRLEQKLQLKGFNPSSKL